MAGTVTESLPWGLTLPPSVLFELPRLPGPSSLPFPESWLQLGWFRIPTWFYNASMEYQCPVVAAVLYLTWASFWSEINGKRQGKPWVISQSLFFRPIIILHNLCLALYSGWAFAATLYMLTAALPDSQATLYTTRVADLLCMGNNLSEFEGGSSGVSAVDMYKPRILFIGWTFYLSKIYEVLDSAIILMKGRRTSTLHKYHHAIVIFCAWTAVRFVCPPAIVALLFNSAIHTVMYSYYTLTALRVPVPLSTKAALTSLQIAQFFVGLILGGAFVFLEYDLPSRLPSDGESYRSGMMNSRSASRGTDREVYFAGTRTVRCVKNSEEANVIWAGGAFVVFLLCMFVRFFVQSYLPPKTLRKRESVVGKAMFSLGS